MQTKLECAVCGVLCAEGGERWKSRLRDHVKDSILGRAIDLLGSPPLDLPEEWDSLDDVNCRVALAGTVEECAKRVALALSSNNDSFRDFKSAVEAAGLGLTRVKLESVLRPELANIIRLGDIYAFADAVTPETLWVDLANLIAAKIHAAESTVPPQSEADCLHWSLLAAFFQVTRIPDATRLGKTLRNTLAKGRFNVRGSLLRNIERTSATGIVDPPLRYVPYAPVTLDPRHRAASHLLVSVAEESVKILDNKGFAISTSGDAINDIPQVPLEDAQIGITEEMVRRSRRFRMNQYEFSALSLSAIASTEFVLRCAAEADPTLGLNASDAKQTEIVRRMTLSPQLKAELDALFSSNGPNFRNRSLHGGFLEIESRRTELTMYSGVGAGIGVPPLNLDSDPYVPRNAAAVALRALGGLDAELAHRDLVHRGSMSWTSRFCLNRAELAFAANLYQPVIDRWANNTKRREICDFAKEALPCLSIPVQLGINAWKDPKPGVSPIQAFALLAVMFEPAMRLLAHAAGFEIFRRRPSAGNRVTLYRMLDEDGFLAPDFLDWIETGLTGSERADARKTIKTGVRCRDAFSHGAIANFDEPTRRAYGAVMAQSICLVMTAAINQRV